MMTTLTSKGQVTIPKRIRDAMQLLPGMPVEFAISAAGEVVVRAARPKPKPRAKVVDAFDAVRGSADVKWRTDDLMKLLRGED